MPEAKVDQMMTDQLVLVEGLYNTAMESNDVETVRGAMAALVNTEAGRVYLRANPMVL